MGNSEGEFDIGDEAAWVAAALVLVASLGGAIVLAEWPLWGVPTEQPSEPQLVEPTDNGTKLWPYTARRPDHSSRTLGINIVFYGNPRDIRTALTEQSALEWESDPDADYEADSDTVSADRVDIDTNATNLTEIIQWAPATGANRYVYVETDGGGRWLGESYQLHSGTYLGSRSHIRAYEDPNEEWTAIQSHEEHWDWFRLRHTVTGISDSQRAIERDFMDKPYVEEVVRMPYDNGTMDADGWVTGVRLVGALLPLALFGVVGRSRRMKRETVQFFRQHRRELGLGGALFALYTAVRHVGILLETTFPALPPKAIAAPLYIALAVGTPAIAYLLGRGSDRVWAFAFAAVGLGAAFVVDFAAMGVSVLPLRVVLHRGAVLLAVGLVAVGAAMRESGESRPDSLVVGALGWLFTLGAPLLGYL
ncbi:hypothetical protein GJ631_05920 [Natronomonas sp. CBA1123]|uniref:hypothetical protein n=1 Tax=Natronomonas sp. CBA1123 TaxID=2668070 RepID=UPI0012EA399C|nr:hypothetical protein [Natronomonas sp. CBA1123]MUV86122.1 hypothetical protein [Natronomonas sp. CBA1123]